MRRLPAGLAASLVAGGVSGLLGVGGGVLKVPVMVLAMKVPIRAAVATSSFMIGVTAATGAMVYMARGLVDPIVTVPVVLGVMVGAVLGARLAVRVRSTDSYHPLGGRSLRSRGADDLGRRGDRSAVNRAVSRILSVGLLAAVALLLIGVVVALVRPDLPLRHEMSIADLPRALAAFEPDGFFQLGLLALVATPVARVVVLGVGYARRREWMFVGISVLVLAVLALSMLWGLSG